MNYESKNSSIAAGTTTAPHRKKSPHVIEVEICVEINDVSDDKQTVGETRKATVWDYLYLLFLASVFVFAVCSVLVGFYGFVKPLTIIYGICCVVMSVSLSLLFGHVFGADYKRGVRRKGGYPYLGL